MMKPFVYGLALLSLTGCGGETQTPGTQTASYDSVEALGEALFNDKNLSLYRTQSCAVCHNPARGFIDPRQNEAGQVGVSLGDDHSSIGVRNTPTAAYASFSPDFHYVDEVNGWKGGQFLDGRAVDLKAQAGGPPLNPVEMAMPSKAAVVERLQENDVYIQAFETFFGESVWQDTEQAYLAMTQAIGRFEKTATFAPFDSKWDLYLMDDYVLSEKEELGRSVFFSPANSSCVNCHMVNDVDTIFGQYDAEQTFSNYRYFNIGVPKNLSLIDLNEAKGLNQGFVANGDHGLSENPQVDDDAQIGKFKTPTLRNVAVTGPYMHNGVFKELRTVLRFYDHRGTAEGSRSPVNPETGAPWAETPFPQTIEHDLLGQTAMSEVEIEGLECFLRLLTDSRYEAMMPATRSDGSVINCSDN